MYTAVTPGADPRVWLEVPPTFIIAGGEAPLNFTQVDFNSASRPNPSFLQPNAEKLVGRFISISWF